MTNFLASLTNISTPALLALCATAAFFIDVFVMASTRKVAAVVDRRSFRAQTPSRFQVAPSAVIAQGQKALENKNHLLGWLEAQEVPQGSDTSSVGPLQPVLSDIDRQVHLSTMRSIADSRGDAYSYQQIRPMVQGVYAADLSETPAPKGGYVTQ